MLLRDRHADTESAGFRCQRPGILLRITGRKHTIPSSGDLLAGTAAYDRLDRAELHLNADVYRVIIYEKIQPPGHRSDASYRFFRPVARDQPGITIPLIISRDDSREIILLKGSFATEKFAAAF
ncbi:MAG: hypothetical protein ACLR7N_12360 [Roseburia hominis]